MLQYIQVHRQRPKGLELIEESDSDEGPSSLCARPGVGEPPSTSSWGAAEHSMRATASNPSERLNLIGSVACL